MKTTFDYLLVGGGLQNALVAAALRRWQPDARVAMLERNNHLAGNHTWSFYEQDVAPEILQVIEPLLASKWSRYRVQFPGFSRVIPQGYYAMTSTQVDCVVRGWFEENPNWQLFLNQNVQSLQARQVVLESNRVLDGKVVIDARGPRESEEVPQNCGFQKFLGWEIELEQDWPEHDPVIMDSRVPQTDGFRFLYILPFSNRRVLVEETYFSDHHRLDKATLSGRLEKLLAERGINVKQIVREEAGVLPMPWGADWSVSGIPEKGPFLAGYAGGWFHPATGYSVSVAARVAEAIAKDPAAEVAIRLQRLASQLGWRQRFGRVLNWMAFRLIRPEYRWDLYRRFYRMLSSSAIARFYSLRFTSWDAMRLVVGWPPAGITFKYLLPRGGHRHEYDCQRQHIG